MRLEIFDDCAKEVAWLSLQKDLMGLSSRSMFVKYQGGHFPHLTATTFMANTIYNFYKQFFSV